MVRFYKKKVVGGGWKGQGVVLSILIPFVEELMPSMGGEPLLLNYSSRVIHFNMDALGI